MMSIPKAMKVVEISKAGGPEVLTLRTRDVPTIQSDEVLIRVEAAGVNGHDIHQRHSGKHEIRAGETDLPGLEVSGEVVAAGINASAKWPVGSQVCALVRGGGYAEYCVADAVLCLPVPKGLSVEEAGGLPETFFTVWANVFQEACINPGETILIQGGASGIGTTAIQLARAFDIRVIATAGTDEKCDACVKLGADVAINHRTEKFEDVVLDRTNGRGVDVVLDIVGGDYVSRELSCMAIDGRLAIIGAALGHNPNVNLATLIRKRLRIIGSVLRPRSLSYKAMIARALRERVWPLLEAGSVNPIVDSVLPFSSASEAHRRIESRQHFGKVLLTTREK